MTGPDVRAGAAVVTVGSELTTGLRVDTNTAEVASALTAAGLRVSETVSLPDDYDALVRELARLAASVDVVVVTGGLGPTHDDVTRDAAAAALGLKTSRDAAIEQRLAAFAARHDDPDVASHIVRQADVIEGAVVLPATVGTAPGQVVPTPRGGRLVLLPGPPREMRPMLVAALEHLPASERAATRLFKCVGIGESDVQMRVERAMESVGATGAVGFTVLARPAEVHVVLTDEHAGASLLTTAADAVEQALGAECFSRGDETLAEVVLQAARERGATVATAESCTGGMVAAALTDVPGSSDVFVGSVVAYSNDLKERLLGVPDETLEAFGAVSEETALAMATGALRSTGAQLAVSVTGIAGPGGAVPGKPVGTVWFALADTQGAVAQLRNVLGDRAGIRERSTMYALDLLRRRLSGLPLR